MRDETSTTNEMTLQFPVKWQKNMSIPLVTAMQEIKYAAPNPLFSRGHKSSERRLRSNEGPCNTDCVPAARWVASPLNALLILPIERSIKAEKTGRVILKTHRYRAFQVLFALWTKTHPVTEERCVATKRARENRMMSKRGKQEVQQGTTPSVKLSKCGGLRTTSSPLVHSTCVTVSRACYIHKFSLVNWRYLVSSRCPARFARKRSSGSAFFLIVRATSDCTGHPLH